MMFDKIKEELNQKLTETKRDRDNLDKQQKDIETKLQYVQGRIEALEEAIACLPKKTEVTDFDGNLVKLPNYLSL